MTTVLLYFDGPALRVSTYGDGLLFKDEEEALAGVRRGEDFEIAARIPVDFKYEGVRECFPILDKLVGQYGQSLGDIIGEAARKAYVSGQQSMRIL